MSHQEDDSLSLPSEENEFQIEVGDRDGYDIIHPEKESSDEEDPSISFTKTHQPPQFLLLKKNLRSVLGNLYDSSRIEEIAENINNHKRYSRPYPPADEGLYRYIEKQLGSSIRSGRSESQNQSISPRSISPPRKSTLKEHTSKIQAEPKSYGSEDRVHKKSGLKPMSPVHHHH